MMYRKRKRISHFGQRLLLVLITLAILLLLALAGCAYWGWRVTSSETSFPNMSLDGIPVGGLTREELALRLTEQRWPGLEDSTLTVLFPLDLPRPPPTRSAASAMTATGSRTWAPTSAPGCIRAPSPWRFSPRS